MKKMSPTEAYYIKKIKELYSVLFINIRTYRYLYIGNAAYSWNLGTSKVKYLIQTNVDITETICNSRQLKRLHI